MDEEDSRQLPFASEPIPEHIAIIMDGNGRWAAAKGRPRVFGHEAGAESIRDIVRACDDWGVRYLTLYAFSTENWKRPPLEVKALMQLLPRYLRAETSDLDEKGVRLHVIGDKERLPSRARKVVDESIARLSKNTGLTLTLALSYGSRDEITRAVQKISSRVAAGEISPNDITEEMLGQNLDTAGMPDPDLLIRTAGELRLSNFMLWQLSYAEYYATDTLWPDFSRESLAEAIRDYQGRNRKFGKVPAK